MDATIEKKWNYHNEKISYHSERLNNSTGVAESLYHSLRRGYHTAMKNRLVGDYLILKVNEVHR